MGHKPKISWWGILLILLIISSGVWVLGKFSNRLHPENFSKLWLVEMNSKPTLFLYSTQSHPGKSSNTGYHFRLLDPITGEVISHREIVINSWKELRIHCITSHGIWASIRNKWRFYAFPDFKTKYKDDGFRKAILEKFPAIGEIHSIQYLDQEAEFEVENNQGELTRFSPTIFDDSATAVLDFGGRNVINPEYYLQIGQLYSYPIPQFMTQQGITITVDDFNTEASPQFRIDEPLVEMLSHDTGFSKYYAVFMPDSSCWLMDGNKRRILQTLKKDSASIVHENVCENKVWLNGDFLRPLKYHAELPKTRLVVNYNSMVFICYHTSLDAKENHVLLTSFDTKSRKEGWTLDLSEQGIAGKYEPFQSTIIDSLVVTVWQSGGRFRITGINVTNGSVVWVFPK